MFQYPLVPAEIVLLKQCILVVKPVKPHDRETDERDGWW